MFAACPHPPWFLGRSRPLLRQRSTLTKLGQWVALALAVLPSSLAQAQSDLHGGSTTKSCEFPTSVAVLGEKNACSGTLIHPSIVLFAGQCGTAIKQIVLGDCVDQVEARVVVPEYCERHPEFADGSPAHDLAYCHLPYRISEIPHTPIAYGCELDALGYDRPAYLVGFGVTEQGSVAWGTKNWGEVPYALPSAGVITTTDGAAGCAGDVGGGLMVQLDDGSWRTIGVLSQTTGPCIAGEATNYFAYVPDALSWLEEASGEDVLPCFAGDGSWQPTQACKNHLWSNGPATPTATPGGGTWDTWCAPTLNSGYASTCGNPSPPDDIAPVAMIGSPMEGAVYSIHDKVLVDAMIYDDVALARVDLLIGGLVAASVKSPPYAWEISGLAPRIYDIGVRAYDEDDNYFESVRQVEVVLDDDDQGNEDDDDDNDSSGDDDDDAATTDHSGSDEEGEEDSASSDVVSSGCQTPQRSATGLLAAGIGLALGSLSARRPRARNSGALRSVK